jgi:hypothetical protein
LFEFNRTVALKIPTITDELAQGSVIISDANANALQTFCLYGPEEDTYGVAACQTVAGYQSLSGNVR